MPRTKQEKADDMTKALTEMALQTRNWARHIRAFLDPTTGVHGYFTVDDWAQEFDQKKTMFRFVKRRMIELRIPIAMDDFGGHYIGKDGDQAKTAASMIKRTITMLNTVRMHLEGIQQSGAWEECEPVLLEGLTQNNFNLDMNDITKLIEGGGFEAPKMLALPRSEN